MKISWPFVALMSLSLFACTASDVDDADLTNDEMSDPQSETASSPESDGEDVGQSADAAKKCGLRNGVGYMGPGWYFRNCVSHNQRIYVDNLGINLGYRCVKAGKDKYLTGTFAVIYSAKVVANKC